MRSTPVDPIDALYQSRTPSLADDLDAKSLLQALDQSLVFYAKAAPNRVFQFGPTQVSASQMRQALTELRTELVSNGIGPDFFDYLKSHFSFYRSNDRAPLLTGYFEAQLNGSRTKSARFQYPLYRKPNDLISINLRAFFAKDKYPTLPDALRGRFDFKKVIVPYYSRDEIDFGRALQGKNLEILWVDNLLDLFFLHIQGSGVVTFPNGKKVQVNYADKNGHPYRAIAKLLIDQGKLTREQASMQSIRAYIEQHPDELREIMAYNPSYVFFREVPVGPLGSIQVPLTPGRSVATDSSLLPPGALAYLVSERPIFDRNGEMLESQRFSRLVLNQDTGGAIKGAGRVDLFTGSGRAAELEAGHLKHSAQIYFLVPNPS